MINPFDRLVKAVWKAIASGHRTIGVAEEIDIKPWQPDFWAAPGEPLSARIGVLAKMAGSHLVVGESETGYLSEDELRRAMLEVQMAWEAWLTDPRNRAESRHRPAAGGPLMGAALIVVAERVAEAMLERVLKGELLERVEAGLWMYRDRFLVYIVCLEDLELRDDTVVLHLMGRSSKLVEAVRRLRSHADPVMRGYGEIIYKEMKAMRLDEPGQNVDPADQRLMDEVVDELVRGFKDEGRREGLREATADDLLRIWRRRFGAPQGWVDRRVRSAESVEVLKTLVEEVAVAPDRAEAEAIVRHALGNGH